MEMTKDNVMIQELREMPWARIRGKIIQADILEVHMGEWTATFEIYNTSCQYDPDIEMAFLSDCYATEGSAIQASGEVPLI